MNWIQNINRCVGPASWDVSKPKEKEANALYLLMVAVQANAQERKPLTDEQIYDVVLAIKTRPPTSLQIARAVEAAHSIKGQP